MLVSLIVLGVMDEVNVVIRIRITRHEWAVQHPLELWNEFWKVMMVRVDPHMDSFCKFIFDGIHFPCNQIDA